MLFTDRRHFLSSSLKVGTPTISLATAVLVLLVVYSVDRPAVAEENPLLKAKPDKIEAWMDKRFGMFIHWGPVSLKGTEIGWSRGNQVPQGEYDNLYTQFNPTNFNAEEWVQLAKDAGMKYIVLTTKHHDGFCLWNTRQTDYNIMHSPFGRDVVKEISDACRKEGIAFGTYYSVCDWHHPDFPLGSPGGTTHKTNPKLDAYTVYLKNQVTELCQHYGPLITMWFDVAQEFDENRGRPVIELVRSLQPDIVINNRCPGAGDYETPEQVIGSFQRNRPWESCITLCQQWAWKPDDPMKPLDKCIRTLVCSAGGDGNLLLNVGPMPDGRIELRQANRLRELGNWLKPRGESIYGTRGGPFKPGRWGVSTHRGNRIFVHIFEWNSGDSITLPPIEKKVLSADLLPTGRMEFFQNQESIILKIQAANRDVIDTIVILKLDGSATEIPPLRVLSPNQALTINMKAAASNIYSQQIATYGPQKAFDDDETTRWATDAGTAAAWIEVDLGAPVAVSQAIIDEWAPRIENYELQYQVNGEWITIQKGTSLGRKAKLKFEPVTGQIFRLNILKASEGPTINEFWLLP